MSQQILTSLWQSPVLDLGHLAGHAVLLQLLIPTPQLTFSPGSPISPGCPCKTKTIQLPATSPPFLPPFSCLCPQDAAPHRCLNCSPCKVPLPHWAVPFNNNLALSAFLLNIWGPPTPDLPFGPYKPLLPKFFMKSCFVWPFFHPCPRARTGFCLPVTWFSSLIQQKMNIRKKNP